MLSEYERRMKKILNTMAESIKKTMGDMPDYVHCKICNSRYSNGVMIGLDPSSWPDFVCSVCEGCEQGLHTWSHGHEFCMNCNITICPVTSCSATLSGFRKT